MNARIQRGEKHRHNVGQRIAIVCSYTLMLIGALALVYSGYVVEDARHYQERAEQTFESLRLATAEPPTLSSEALTTPVAPGAIPAAEATPAIPEIVAVERRAAAPSAGDVIGRLAVPRIGLSAMLAEGDSGAVLRHAVGHLSDTPLPGDPGNTVFAGHRDTFFRPLRNIRVGDVITIETVADSYQYTVEWFRVMPPDNVSVLAPSETNDLTLITCFPFNYIGPAPDRFVVRAREVGANDQRVNAE